MQMKSQQLRVMVMGCPHELHRKLVAEAFWTAECEAELRESNKIDHYFKCVGAREELMDTTDKERANTTYSHLECSEECRKRGKTTNNNTKSHDD